VRQKQRHHERKSDKLRDCKGGGGGGGGGAEAQSETDIKRSRSQRHHLLPGANGTGLVAKNNPNQHAIFFFYVRRSLSLASAACLVHLRLTRVALAALAIDRVGHNHASSRGKIGPGPRTTSFVPRPWLTILSRRTGTAPSKRVSHQMIQEQAGGIHPHGRDLCVLG